MLSSVYSKEGLEDVTLESWRAVVKLERVSLDGKGQGEGKGLRLRGEEGVSYWVPYGGEDQRKFEIGKKGMASATLIPILYTDLVLT